MNVPQTRPEHRAGTILHLLRETVAATQSALSTAHRNEDGSSIEVITRQLVVLQQLPFWKGWKRGELISVIVLDKNLQDIRAALKLLLDDDLKGLRVPLEPDAAYYQSRPLLIGRLEIVLGLLRIAHAEVCTLLVEEVTTIQLSTLDRDSHGYGERAGRD